MNEWLKTNAVALITATAMGVGLYTTNEVSHGRMELKVDHLEEMASKFNGNEIRLTLVEKTVSDLSSEVTELKPIMAGLSKNIYELNLTLSKFQSSSTYMQESLTELHSNQKALQNDIQDIKLKVKG